MECWDCKCECNKTGYGTVMLVFGAIFYKCPKCNTEYWRIDNEKHLTKSHWKRIKHQNRKRGKGNHVYR